MKESIETETATPAWQEKQDREKERTDIDLIFFLVFCCISNMLVRWVATSVRLPQKWS